MFGSSRPVESRSLIRASWRTRVEQLLALAIRQRPDLQLAAARVREPLDVLQQLGAVGVGALTNRPWDGQMLDLVVRQHSHQGLDFRQVRELLVESITEAGPGPSGCSALVDPGLFVIAGLAAVRVAAPRALVVDFLNILFGLIVALGPAEDICQLRVPPSELANAVIRVLSGVRTERAERTLLPGSILSMLTNPKERARWMLFSRLLEELDHDASEQTPSLERDAAAPRDPEWMSLEGALAVGELAPPDAAPGERVQLRVGSEWVAEGLELRFLAPDGARSLGAPVFPSGDDQAWAQVPHGAGPGWVWLAVLGRDEVAGQARRALASRWARLSDQLIPDDPVPKDILHRIATTEPVPPWPVARPFDGGYPCIEWHSPVPAALHVSERFELAWTSLGAHYVRVGSPGQSAPASAAIELVAPRHAGEWTLCLTPVRVLADGREISGPSIEARIEVAEP